MTFYQLLSTVTTLGPVFGAIVIAAGGAVIAYMSWTIRSCSEDYTDYILDSSGGSGADHSWTGREDSPCGSFGRWVPSAQWSGLYSSLLTLCGWQRS